MPIIVDDGMPIRDNPDDEVDRIASATATAIEGIVNLMELNDQNGVSALWLTMEGLNGQIMDYVSYGDQEIERPSYVPRYIPGSNILMDNPNRD